MTTQPIEANISVTITYVRGPIIDDSGHVLAWLCADGTWIEGRRNGFMYEVCPLHADPDECGECPVAHDSTYRATIVSADLDEIS